MTWHHDAETLAAYAENDLGGVMSASVEAHVVACGECRTALRQAPGVDRGRHEAVWDALVDVVDRPRAGVLEVLLTRLGLPAHQARLLAGTSSLQRAWLMATAAAVVFAVVAAGDGGRHLGWFLVVAPLLPLAGVVAAHGATDAPISEVLAASPVGRFRLLMIRTVAVTSMGAVLLTPSALVASRGDIAAAAWLLPGFALASSAVALSAWFPAERVAGSLALVWVATAALSTRPFGPGSAADALAGFAAFGPVGQIACALLAAGALVVAADRSRVADLRSMP